MLRTSSYVIYVPLPNTRDELLIVHGYTGAYDKVSARVADYLRAHEVAPPAKPLYGDWVSEPTSRGGGEAYELSARSMESLRRRGYLTSMTPQEEEGFFARIAKKMHRWSRANPPSYIIMPTYSCNLRCSYCFQDHMRTNPAFQHLLRRMTEPMADRILAAMPQIERDHGIEDGDEVTRRIKFFGGEPLLAANRPIVEYIMTRARAMGEAVFSAVSNATELEAYDDLLGEAGIRQIQITLDGPPEEHDTRRIYADGSGSFAKIARNIDLCLDRGVKIGIRVNLDRNNIELLPRLCDVIVDRGWPERKGFSMYAAPIQASNDKTDLETTFNSWELNQAIAELRSRHESVRIIGTDVDSMKVRAQKVFGGKSELPQFRESFCGAHTGMYIFDSFGDIYACWERTGDPRIRIGRVTESGEVVMESGLHKLWRSRTVASNPTCRKCRYAMHCGGGCAVLAEAHTGTMFNNHCDAFGERFRHAVAQAYLNRAEAADTAVGVQVPAC
ncbi:MAG TPA: radical SAM protein [Longimicrobiales bacterium]